MKTEIDNKTALTYSIILALVVIGLLTTVRIMNNPNYPGDQAYYHLNVVEKMHNNAIASSFDNERPILLSIYDLSLYGLSSILGIKAAFFVMPALTGLILLLGFYLILARLGIKPENILISLVMLVLSPIFIYSSFIINPISFYAALSVLAFYLLMLEDNKWQILSIIIFFFVSLSSLFCTILNLIIFLGYYLHQGTKRNRIINVSIASIVGMIGYSGYMLYFYGLPELPNFVARNIVQDYFSELGGLISFCIFSLVLFFFGFYFMREDKEKYAPAAITVLLLFIVSLFSDKANIYTNLFVAVIAGYGFYKFLKMQWSSALMKIIMIMTIVVGILFTSFTFASSLSDAMPSIEMVKSLEFLNGHSKGDGIVLSYYTKGNIIRQISKNDVLIDSQIYHYHNLSGTNKDANGIFKSSELKKTKMLLDKYNITYIYIDSDMKADIWKNNRDGLLYLFTNNETFNNIYNKGDIEIWEVKRGQ